MENPVNDSIDTSMGYTPKTNLQIYGKRNINQGSVNESYGEIDKSAQSIIPRHKHASSVSDLNSNRVMVKNVMSRFERRARNKVAGEIRQNSNSPPKVEKAYDSDEEDFT